MPLLTWFEEKGDDFYYGYDMRELGMDQAYVTPKSMDGTQFSIYSRHEECLGCPYSRKTFTDGVPMILSGVPYYQYRISTDDSPTIPAIKTANHLCDIDKIFGSFGEFGVYDLQVNRAGCYVREIKEPVSVWFPTLTVFLLFCAIFLGIYGLVTIWNKFVAKKSPVPEKSKKERVRSLDTFRGISIVVMIFVNYGGGSYEELEHAAWNGLHLADLVFPWFMWIMGVCIPISLASSFKRQVPSHTIFFNVLLRSIKLFLLGIFLNGGNSLECLRIFGVLQRFGICYLVATTLCIFLMKREDPSFKNKYLNLFVDIFKLQWVWLATLTILLAHFLIIFLVTEDDCPRGYLGPGGWHKNMEYMGCTGGATGYIDRLILGKHAYQWPTILEIYNSQAFDPEGILGCLTSIFHVVIGVQAGVTMMVYKKHTDRLVRWLSWGAVAGIIGGGLCGFSKEDGVIPLNKNLWSTSFCLVTSCFAFILLSFCYVLIDIKRWWSGKPFLFAGMNSIILYAGHEMIGNFPIRWNVYCDGGQSTHFVALFENVWGISFWVLFSYYMYKINYFYSL